MQDAPARDCPATSETHVPRGQNGEAQGLRDVAQPPGPLSAPPALHSAQEGLHQAWLHRELAGQGRTPIGLTQNALDGRDAFIPPKKLGVPLSRLSREEGSVLKG